MLEHFVLILPGFNLGLSEVGGRLMSIDVALESDEPAIRLVLLNVFAVDD